MLIGLVLFVDRKPEFGTGPFRFRSVLSLGGMARAEREEDDVTNEAAESKGAKIVIARSSHGSAELGVGNEGLPPRRFLVAVSS